MLQTASVEIIGKLCEETTQPIVNKFRNLLSAQMRGLRDTNAATDMTEHFQTQATSLDP
jgi:hypothetical protein